MTPANTRQPRCASLRAMSIPMPMAAPVTTADLVIAATSYAKPSAQERDSRYRRYRFGTLPVPGHICQL